MTRRPTITAGGILAASEAMQTQQEFNREQVTYLVALAYEMGLRHSRAEDLAETIGCWQTHMTPRQTREQRIAARLAAYEKRSGPPRYRGGPVEWETERPTRLRRVA